MSIQDRFEIKPSACEFNLVHYETYEDYLDTLYTEKDICYLQDKDVCRKIAEYGYRSDSRTYTRKEFRKKRDRALEYIVPKKLNVMISSGMKYGDPAQIALALRERANRVGIITTIIFMNGTTPQGLEVSGYVDFAHSLLKKDWKKFFVDGTPIYPDRNDLGFYNWKKNETAINNSMYFKTIMAPKQGLLFQHKFDRILVVPDPYGLVGQQNHRQRVKTDMYHHFVVIDHIVRSRK